MTEELAVFIAFVLAPIGGFSLLLFLWNVIVTPLRMKQNAVKTANESEAKFKGEKASLQAEINSLQAEINSQKPNVELTNFCQDLQYNLTTMSGMPMIAIQLTGILRNTSMRNHGSLDFFRIEIPTPMGIFVATCNAISQGYKFEPNSIHPHKVFIFAGEASEPGLYIQSENPDLNVKPWEPFIKGAKGRINLAVQGQEIKTYPIKIADRGGFA